MEVKPNKDRTGEKHISNQGYEIEIIGCFGALNCTIQFEDGTIRYNIQYDNIKRGTVKNFYHKSPYGVGYFGVGKYTKNDKNHSKTYKTWTGMLERCYDNKLQEKRPSYIECFVDEEWHNFQNFAQWFYGNYRPETMQGWHLDKDILVKNNKIYSSETCCFVPNEINGIFSKSGNPIGDYPVGVVATSNKYKARVSIYNKRVDLGTYFTVEEAFQAYKAAKENHIKQTAEKWKDQISEPTYQALINYTVEITD
jgi:hypothetical protein